MLERILELYLKANKIKYSLKDGVYELDLPKKIFGTGKVIGSFDPKTKHTFLGRGSDIMDTILQSQTGTVYGSFEVVGSPDELLSFSEAIDGKYPIDEIRLAVDFALIKIRIRIIDDEYSSLIPFFYTDRWARIADPKGLRLKESGQLLVDPDKNTLRKHLRKFISKDLKRCEALHFKKTGELIRVISDHVQMQYDELGKEEGHIRSRIGMAEHSMINASTFESRNTWSEKIRSMKQRLKTVIADNGAKREKIKAQFEREAGDIRRRKIEISGTILAHAHLDAPAFRADRIFLPLIGDYIQATR